MGNIKKQTRKLRQKAAGVNMRRLPRSATAHANKRRRVERERVVAEAAAIDDDSDVANSHPAKRSVAEMDIDELLRGDANDHPVQDEVAKHAAQIQALADTDPDFYKHLIDNNPDLLKFGAGDDDNDDDDDVEIDDDDDGDDADLIASTSVDLATVVPALLRSVRQSNSVRSLKHLVRLFRVAAHAGDDDQDGDAGEDQVESDSGAAVRALRVDDPSAFDRFFRTLLKHIPRLLTVVLGSDPKRSPHWKQLESGTRSFLGNAVHAAGQCVEPRLLRRLLRTLGPHRPLFVPFPKLCHRYLRALLQIWGQGISDQARIEAFLQLRALIHALRHRPAFVSAAFRGLYGTFVRNAKFLTAVNAPMLRFMQNCIVEVFALDVSTAYQHAFIYLRHLAVRLRANQAQVDAQLLNSVRVWSRVLSRLGGAPDSALRPLCYPFIQVVLVMAASHAASKYFPLHLQCAEMLHEVGAVAAGLYIPVAPLLLGVVCATNWASIGEATARAATKTPPVETMIAAPNSLLRSKAFQDVIVQRAVTLLRLHLTRHSRSIAFPELGASIRRALRKFAADTKIVRFRKLAQKLAVQIESNIVFIETRRADSQFAPKDKERIQTWSAALPKTPLEAYTESAGGDAVDDDSPPTCVVEDENQDDDDSESDSGVDAAVEEVDEAGVSDSGSDADPDIDDVVDDLVLSSDSDEDDGVCEE